MEDERICLEGAVKGVDLVNFNVYNSRLFVLIESNGMLYNTFIERDGNISDHSTIIIHLEQTSNALRQAKRVKVTVEKQDGREDMPLYRVIKQYQILEER